MFRTVRALAACVAAIVVLTLPQLQASAQTDRPRYGGTLVYALAGEPAHLNGAITTSLYEVNASASIFDTLVELDQELRPLPSLATSWKVSPDGLRYEFTLADATWHDGKRVTAEDVRFTFEDVFFKAHPRGATLRPRLKSVETPRPNSVILNLEAPFSPLMVLLGTDVKILPKHVYSGGDIKSHPANLTPIGSGPFKFVEWVKGSHVTVERNPNYFKPGKPYLDKVVFKVVPDAVGRVLALESGDIHYISYYMLPSADVERLKKNPNIGLTDRGVEAQVPILSLIMNTRHPILGKREVRQAIYHAIDRPAINQRAHFGLGRVATGPIPSIWKWAYNPAVAQRYPYDVARANQLLDQAGFPKKADGTRFEVRLTFDRGIPLFVKSAEILAQELKAAGIAVTLQPVDRPTMLDRVYTKWDFDLNVHAMDAGPDPAIGVSRLYHSKNQTHAPFSNGSGYDNPKVDELFDKAARVTSLDERGAMYKEIQTILLDDVPILWLTEYGTVSAWRKEFSGLHSRSGNSLDTTTVDAWWTKGKESR
jgi:peptide/nickel transport system substrate-binding protein